MNNAFRPRQIFLATALALFAVSAAAEVQGYLSTSRGTIVKSGTGLCWRTTGWSGQHAVEPCDPVPKVEAPMPVAAGPEPKGTNRHSGEPR